MDFPFQKTSQVLVSGTMLVLACLLGTTGAHASTYQKMYKWVDHKGSTHYTLTPPPANAKKASTMMTYNDAPSGSSNSTYPQAENSNNNNSYSSTNANANNQSQAQMPVMPSNSAAPQ